jgi:hypothetical protein
MVGVGSTSSCRALFKKFEILPVPCQYTFSLVMFFVDNLETFQANLLIHGVDTRNKTVTQTCYQALMFSEVCFLWWYEDFQYSTFQYFEFQK